MTLRQVAGILGGDSVQIGLEGHWRTPCFWTSNHVTTLLLSNT